MSTLTSSRLSQENLELIRALQRGMNQGRNLFNYSLITSTPITAYWLLGFVEAEGTFGISSLSPYFQVAQHGNSLHVLRLIESFLGKLTNGFLFSTLSVTPSCSLVLNKATGVYSLTVQDIDSLYGYVLFFFLGMTFQTRKFIDFKYWALTLYLHKFGFIYTPEGRGLVNAISKFINDGRYTNNPSGPILPPTDDDIQCVLQTKLPVTLTPEMSHTQLSRAFTTAKGKNSYTV